MRLLLKLLWLTLYIISSYSADSQNWEKVYSDTNNFVIHTATVQKNNYIGFLNRQIFYLLNARGDTILTKSDFYFNAEFKDFNKDGNKDILLHYSSNAPMVLDLFLYETRTGRFREVINFRDFPATEQINGTKFYYSYHKSGCADMNWDSDLFYIKDFQAIRIGNIAGRQCNNRDEEKDAVYIHKVQSGKEKLFKTLPIDTIYNYKDFKWGFINEYWTKNYKLFL